MYRPVVIALLMRFLQQLTGITPILVYLQSIFDSTAVLLVRACPRPSAPGPKEAVPAERLPCPGPRAHPRLVTISVRLLVLSNVCKASTL